MATETTVERDGRVYEAVEATLPQRVPQVAVNAERLLGQAIEKNVPIETLERLLALREKLKAEQAREAFFAALTAAQGEFPICRRTKTAKIESSRGAYTYTYAPLEVIVAQVTPILQAHGLSVTFDTAVTDTALKSFVTVHHVAGHSQSSSFEVPIDKAARMNDAQKVASANTYSKRYAYCNALGILTGDDDDDAHSAGAKVTGGPVEPFGTPRRKSEAVVFPEPTQCSHGVPLAILCDLCMAETDREIVEKHYPEAAAGPTPPPPARASPAAVPDPRGGGHSGSVDKPTVSTATAPVRGGDAQGSLTPELPPKPKDAITDGKAKKLYLDIRTALKRHNPNADTRANVEAVKAKLKAYYGLPHIDFLSWRDFDECLSRVDALAEEVARR